MSFDLNIENYTRDELIQMFELPMEFDKNMVEFKESILRESILTNNEVTNDIRSKTIHFLTQAKTTILDGLLHTNYNLLNKKEDPYINSYPGEFFPGTMNPLKKRTLKKNLNIDTRFRDNYYNSSSTNFNLILPVVFNNVIQIQLSAIELPTSFYVISKQYGNNFFNITVNNVKTTINIPDGNYDQNTIISAINNKLIVAGAPFTEVMFVINLTNGTTGSGQTMVSDISNNIIELDFQADKYGNYDTGTPLPLKLGWLLGFRNGVYTENTSYVSEGILDVTGPKYFFLVVDDHNNSVNNSFYSAFNSSILNKNILARISLQQSNAFNILEQNNLNLITTPREYFGPVNLQNLQIQLLDEYGRIVYLNNMDFSFCITLTTVYDI
jgi:hypothetical protein